MDLYQMLDTAIQWAAGNLPYVVGGGVAVAVVTLAMFLNRRRGLDPAKLAAVAGTAPRPVERDKSAHWAPPEQSYADRRGAVRRDGQPVRVLVASTAFRNGAEDGYVVDRSTGGLRIALQSAVAPGSILQVRAVDAPDTIGFVTVIVRSCRKNTDFFEVGCEFEKTPPWNVLLLFG
jgi:hypothetical protein